MSIEHNDRISELEQRINELEARREEELRLLRIKDRETGELHHRLHSTTKDLRLAHDDLAMQLALTRTAHIEIIRRLSLAAEFKDQDTAEHLDRMSHYSALMAEALGKDDDWVENLLYAAPMHDVGKIGVADGILLKPGKLTEDEHKLMRLHTVYGAQILGDSESEIIQLAHTIAIGHHEKWNGEGYPYGKKGEEIPIEARIVYIADLFDALTSRRPYKDAYPAEVAADIIKQESGTSLDPQVVEVFFERFDEILELRSNISPEENLHTDNFEWSERDIEARKQ